MQLFLKLLSGMANSVVPDQTALEGAYAVCICHFVRNLGVQNFITFTISKTDFFLIFLISMKTYILSTH